MVPRKVIIDCDPGIDDAVALAIALFEPSLEVLAVTATEGNASAEQTTRNVQTVVECLDPPRYPRFGKASSPEFSPPTDIRKFHGGDGLGNLNAEVSVLHHERASDKLICDVVRSAPEEVTIICLGPLTNVARAMQRAPEMASMIGQLIMIGGTVNGIGNATACAEYNIYYDPAAADTVFQSPTTKTLIPLDVTRQTVFSLDLFDELPPEETTGGAFLHHILQHTFRAHRSHLGLEGIQLHDAIAVVAAIQPKLFTTEQMHGQVETGGQITSGMTIFDRRPANRERANMAVATGINVAGVKQCIVSGLTRLS